MNSQPPSSPPCTIRKALLAVLVVFTSPLLAPAQPAADPQKPPPATELVELPAYVVRGDRVLPPPESWRHVVIPHLEILDGKGNSVRMMQGFEVLSIMSVQNTRVFAQELQLRQLAFALFWPSLGAKQPGESPIILINENEDPWRDGLDAPLIEWEGMSLPQSSPSAPAAMAPMQGDPFATLDNTTDSIFRNHHPMA